MKKIDRIKPATQCRYSVSAASGVHEWLRNPCSRTLRCTSPSKETLYPSAHIIDQCACVLAATELEAAAIASSNSKARTLNGRSEQTYIFSIERHSQIRRFTVDPAMLLQETFKVWQDLAGEATGCDTEWGYSISINSIAEAFHISPNVLLILLANLTQPNLGLYLTKTALTFHSHPDEVNQSEVYREMDVVYLSDLTRSKPFVPNETQLFYATSVA